MLKKLFILLSLILGLASCGDGNGEYDAYGNFETVATIISAEANGRMLRFDIEEGQTLQEGDTVGLVDTAALQINLRQAEAKKKAVMVRSSNVFSQIDVLEEKLEKALHDKSRLEKLFADEAATQKQLDDINSAVAVLDKQIESVKTQNAPIVQEARALDAQIDQIKLMLEKSMIINPVEGTVLNKFAEPHEIVAAGKPLYKIANMDEMILRVYISGVQLSQVKVGQQVEVFIDKDNDSNRKLRGKVSWIAPEAEFTPKIIQTKEERVNLVYAVKVIVKNDGSLKIGMPGSIRL